MTPGSWAGTEPPANPNMPPATNIGVGPHEFRPMGKRDRTHLLGRCKACYLPRYQHPVEGWTSARPLGDDRPAVPWATQGPQGSLADSVAALHVEDGRPPGVPSPLKRITDWLLWGWFLPASLAAFLLFISGPHLSYFVNGALAMIMVRWALEAKASRRRRRRG